MSRQRSFGSLLAVGLVLAVPLTSRAEDTDVQRQLKELVDKTNQAFQDITTFAKQSDRRIAELEKQVAELKQERKAEQPNREEPNRQLAELQKQVAELKQELKVKQLNLEIATLRAQLIETQTALAAMQNRNQQLEAQLERILREQGQPKPAKQPEPAKNPPKEQVEGVVQQVDPTGLFKINIGSDAGLARGHTLEVYRIDRENPRRSRYLGTIRITDVNHKDAVGTPLGGKMLGPIQVGDQVASKIVGG